MLAQTESHADGSSTDERHTVMSYLGLTTLVSGEDHFEGDSDAGDALTTKSYSYDAWGHRISLTNDETAAGSGGSTDPDAESFTYAYDVHGSVSLLIDESSTATASYGYRPYGGANDALTAGDIDPSDSSEDPGREDNPLNAFRYSGRRLDTGSGSIDMGARRYGPDTGRFLQRDFLNSALGDLGLSLDPLTQGRYNFAGGNPISFVEWDGHIFYINGSGGGGCLENCDDGGSAEQSDALETALFWAGRALDAALGASATAAQKAGQGLIDRAFDVVLWTHGRAEQIRRSAWPIVRGLRATLWEEGGLLAADQLADTGRGLVRLGVRVTQALGALTVVVGSADQYTADASRDDLLTVDTPLGTLEVERAVRAGTAGFVEALGGLLGGAGGWALCGGQVTGVLCAGAGGAAGGTVAKEFVVQPVLGLEEHVFDWIDSLFDGNGSSSSF